MNKPWREQILPGREALNREDISPRITTSGPAIAGPHSKMDWLLRFLAFLFGVVFIYSGGVKLWDPQAFAQQVQAYRILPLWGVPTFAAIMPVFELLTGAWLCTGWKRRPPILAAIGLLIIFIVALGLVLLRGLDINCGCFGTGSDSPLMALMRDLVLLGIAVLLYWRELNAGRF